MKLKNAFAAFIPFFAAGFALAQDLGPQIRKLEDGVYVYVGKNFNSNCGIVLTREGVVLIDGGHNPTDSRAIMEAVRKLTPLPIRFLIDTEPHPDHTTGHFVFSPPATIIAAEGAGESMRSRERGETDRIQKLAATSPEMRAALEGYRFVTPDIEYHQKMTLKVGERAFELMHLKGVHSESDTAVWLPKERVLFSAAGIVVNQINNLRPIVSDEEPEPGARRSRARDARHGEDLRGQRKILRAAPRARRQAGKRRQVAGPDQEGSAHARVRELGRAGTLPDQRRGGLPGGERRLSATSPPAALSATDPPDVVSIAPRCR